MFSICNNCNNKEICLILNDLKKYSSYIEVSLQNCSKKNTLSFNNESNVKPIGPFNNSFQHIELLKGPKPDLKELEKQYEELKEETDKLEENNEEKTLECSDCKNVVKESEIEKCSICGTEICMSCGTHAIDGVYCEKCW